MPKAALADLTSLGSLEHTFEPQATRMGGVPYSYGTPIAGFFYIKTSYMDDLGLFSDFRKPLYNFCRI